MAAENAGDAVAAEFTRETNFAHIIRMAAEAKLQEMAAWVTERVDRQHKYKSSKGDKLRRELRQEGKALAGYSYLPLRGTPRWKAACVLSSPRTNAGSADGTKSSPDTTSLCSAGPGNPGFRTCGKT